MDYKTPTPSSPVLDDVPPPSYDESQNAAYNPAYLQPSPNHSPRPTPIPPYSPTFEHSTATAHTPSNLASGSQSPHTLPSAPILPESTNLYPEVPTYQHMPLSSPPTPSPQRHPIPGYYHSVVIPAYDPRYHHPYQGGSVVRYPIVDPSERRFPIAALFFLFGWFCPPLWVLGACCCSGSHNRYEAWWGKVNFIMAVMFIVSSIIYSMIAVTMGDWMVGLRILSFYTE